MAGFIAKGVGFNVDESARSDERDSEGVPLRRGDVYIANVPWSFIAIITHPIFKGRNIYDLSPLVEVLIKLTPSLKQLNRPSADHDLP